MAVLVQVQPRPFLEVDMNILVIGNARQPHSTEMYIAEALQALGHQVHKLNEGQHFPRDVLDYVDQLKPDWTLFSKCELRGLEYRDTCTDVDRLCGFLCQLKQRCKTVCWCFDLMRKEFSSQRHSWAKAVAEEVTLFLSTDSELGFGHCLRQGYPGPVEVPVLAPPTQWKALFLGSLFGERRSWFQRLRAEFGSELVHYADGVFNDDLFDAMESAKLVLGPLHPRYSGYWSNRLYVVTGYGGCFVAPVVHGMLDEGWRPWVHYLPVSSESKEAVEQAKEYSAWENNALRRVAQQGREFCLANFTYKHRCETLVRMLDEA